MGTVGLPIPGVEVRIAEDAEILVKGGNVCSGYFRDAAGTAALLDEDGWMHSGDAGSSTTTATCASPGRKKDLIITTGGQNIAPRRSRSTSGITPDLEAVVVGEGRRTSPRCSRSTAMS